MNPHVLSAFLTDSDSDDDLEMFLVAPENEAAGRQRRHRGSTPDRRYYNRNRVEGHNILYNDYCSDNPVHHEIFFRRRFRMRRPLFCRILSAVESYDPYFVQKKDAIGVPGLSCLHKVIAAFRVPAYGSCADILDDLVCIGESTTLESLRHFVKAIVDIFGEEYLRAPNENDIARLLHVNEQRGFPGMVESIDCMHWEWQNCPSEWEGMYTGHSRSTTIILEAVASHDLWIWHAFFGMPGSLNDINVLVRSPVFSALASGCAPPVNFTVNGNNYTMGYYLADGTYPTWATFVKTIPAPQRLKEKHFAKVQEGARKDVERAFGVLQARFNIVRGSSRYWDDDILAKIMKACIIMHNVIIEDENGPGRVDFMEATPNINVSREPKNGFDEFIENQYRIRDRGTHFQLQHDLIEHIGVCMVNKVHNFQYVLFFYFR